MILLKDKANVAPVDADYPYGNIKNDSGVGDGTAVDVQCYADFHQFFERLFALSGMTANGLPDNETNGFQLYEAFEKLVGREAWQAATITPTITANTGTAVFHSPPYSKFKKNGKTIIWNFVAGITCTGSPTQLSISLPTTLTMPAGIASAIMFTGLYQGANLVIVNISNSSTSVYRPDNSAFSNAPGQLLSFSATFEIQ